ncbi:MAG: hypothetical protein H0U10_03615 [Chloroflexia bacterium]|nr:hypothetical protein [Chloroflexia bacterium]
MALRRPLVATLGAALARLLCLAPLLGAAADATPVPAADTPPPSLCTAEAPPLAQLNAEIAEVTAGAATPESELPGRLDRGVVPAGMPADAATVSGIEAATRELVACFNAGEPLRALGLYTPVARGSLYARHGPFTADAYAGLARPMPADPAERDAILAIRDVRVLADGRAGATVIIAYAVVPEPKRFFFVYVRPDVGDRWLIDGILGELSFSVP